jgi:ribosome-associated translation inhibitor RaiA
MTAHFNTTPTTPTSATPMTLTPVQTTFRHMTPSPSVEARIREETADLDLCFGRITSCHVIVDAPHQHHAQNGRTFHVSIEIHVPGTRIVVNRNPSQHSSLVQGQTEEWEKHLETQADHKDIYVCIRDAFQAARRRLDDYARVLRGDVKHHAGKD